MADGKLQEAVAQFTRALALDPKFALAYNGRGFAFLRLKQYSAAVADFDQAIRLNPAYANAYQNRSAARRAMGDCEGAEADLAKSRTLAK